MRHADKGVYSKSIMLLKIWFYSRSYGGVFVISSIPDSPIHFALSAKHSHLP